MNARRIRIRTPSRLHFGLLGWGPQAARQFGGVGLMIEDPGLELIGETAAEWTFEGPLAPVSSRSSGDSSRKAGATDRTS